MNLRGFASDNNAGVHPEIMQAMADVNIGHAIAYGDDPYTKQVTEKIRRIFGQKTEPFFVFLGTAANVLALDAITQPYNAVICAETAHINTDECGAPERFTGCKLLTVPSPDGKLTVEGIKTHMHDIGFEHHVQPKIISITQATELGTVYTEEEVSAICKYAHSQKMKVHMDGARFCNAAVSLNTGLREISTASGVDILSFGGTKNGLMYGEAILFFDPLLASGFKYRRKQSMQLSSKMRFIAAQFNAYLENDLWKRNATHANEMAALLASEVSGIPGVTITQKVEANGVFAIIPEEVIPRIQKEYFFYVWDEDRSEVRWMTSFDTTKEDVLNFSSLLRKLMKA